MNPVRPTTHRRVRRPGLRTVRGLAVSIAALVAMTGGLQGVAQAEPEVPVAAVAAGAICYPLAAVAPAPFVASLVVGSKASVLAGRRLTGAQVDVARTIVDAGKELGVGRRGATIALAVALQTSGLKASTPGGIFGDDKGVLDSAKAFYADLITAVPGYATDRATDRTLVGKALAGDRAAKATGPDEVVLADSLSTIYWTTPSSTVNSPADPALVSGPTANTREAGSLRPTAFLPLRGAGGAFMLSVDPTDVTGSETPPTTDRTAVGPSTTPEATTGDVETDTSADGSDVATTEVAESVATSTDVPTTDTPVTDPAPSTTPVTTAPSPPATTPPATTPPSTPVTTAPSPPATTPPATTAPATTAPSVPATTGAPKPPADTTTAAPTTAVPAQTSTEPNPIDGNDPPAVVFEPTQAPIPTDDADPDLPPNPEPIAEQPPAVPLPQPEPEQVPASPTTDPVPSDPAPATPSIPVTPASAGADCAPNTNGGSTSFDPGQIISDAVFYNSASMTVDQIRGFVATTGSSCEVDDCLKYLTVTTVDQPADRYCSAYRGGTNEDVATVLARVSLACGISPQVMLTTLQKESGLLTRTDVTADSYDAAWGWHCPDSGPGGSANCDPAYAGFFNQAYGMAKQWARYRLDPEKYNYQAGETVDILWNVAETGCGSAPVTIANVATASLYNYTPYQPNAAALTSYPGVGDACSAYGNRNFFFLFQKYFGVTGGGVPASVSIRDGVDVVIPANANVTAGLAGKVVKAPNAKVAQGIAAGFASIGLPYVWGGGTNSGPADQGCSRGGGSSNSCTGVVGFDCSGLTSFVLGTGGYQVGTNSYSQRAGGTDVAWNDALPGDIIGYSGHVAIYLGYIDGVEYLLEAPQVGDFVQIRPVYRSNGGVAVDSVMHRYWS